MSTALCAVQQVLVVYLYFTYNGGSLWLTAKSYRKEESPFLAGNLKLSDPNSQYQKEAEPRSKDYAIPDVGGVGRLGLNPCTPLILCIKETANENLMYIREPYSMHVVT